MQAKNFRFLRLLGAGVALTATAAIADQVTLVPAGTYGTYYNQTIGGGEYSFKIVSGAGSSSTAQHLTDDLTYYDNGVNKTVGVVGGTINQPNFQTFCVEVGEFITSGSGFYAGPYDVTLGEATQYGGPLGTRTITEGAAWLYSEFARGELAGYSYTGTSARINSAGLLQTAIWGLMSEKPAPSGNIFYDMAITKFGNGSYAADTGAFAHNSASGYYDVAILSLWQSGTVQNGLPAPRFARQDVLILDGPDHHIPDGGMTIALLGVGLTFLGSFGYRIRK